MAVVRVEETYDQDFWCGCHGRKATRQEKKTGGVVVRQGRLNDCRRLVICSGAPIGQRNVGLGCGVELDWFIKMIGDLDRMPRKRFEGRRDMRIGRVP